MRAAEAGTAITGDSQRHALVRLVRTLRCGDDPDPRGPSRNVDARYELLAPELDPAQARIDIERGPLVEIARALEAYEVHESHDDARPVPDEEVAGTYEQRRAALRWVLGCSQHSHR